MANSVDEIIKRSEKLITSGKLTDANELLKGAINILDTTSICPIDTENIEYKSFDKPIEEVLYQHLFLPKKEVSLTSENYSALYRMYGRLLIEMKDYENAKTYLIKALKWNPMNLTARFEYAESYRAAKDMEMFLAINAEILKYSYHTRALSRAYTNLAFYFYELKNIDLSTALIYVALEFDKDFEGAKNIFNLITESNKHALKKPSEKTVRKLFKKNSIQFGASDEIIAILYSYGLHYSKMAKYKSARYFLKYSYGLSADASVLRMLKILPAN